MCAVWNIDRFVMCSEVTSVNIKPVAREVTGF